MVTALLCIPFLYYGDWWGALLCMLAGFLVDVDHEVDYYIFYGTFTLSIKALSETVANEKHYYCPLHSWELLLAIFLLSTQYPALFGASVGICVHLILDIYGNHMNPLSLFLAYRFMNDFRRVGVYGCYNPHEE